VGFGRCRALDFKSSVTSSIFITVVEGERETMVVYG
jgi:hypothetical protein